MLTQTLRSSRTSLARLARSTATKRTFISSSSRRADLVQDLYLKELRAYKAPTVKASDADGHVQKWAAPKAPPSPEEADIARELKAYEDSKVEVEGQAEGGVAAEAEQDWFEEEPEEEHAH